MRTLILSLAISLPLICSAQQKKKAEAYDKSVPEPTHKQVRYGEHERHVMDVWIAKTASAESPAPLAFVIHGGGWQGGSKERLNRFADAPRLLDAGISVVAINYRYVKQAVAEGVEPPVKAPLHDAARALQFVRSKAGEWHIDKNRVGAAGGSAGACSSLWLAFHDDLADPDSDDPVARESSRLQCAAVNGAQTTLDPKQMKEWTPNSRYGGHAFGKRNFAEFLADRDEIMPWIKEYSPYQNVSKDDPPVYLIYKKPPAIGQEQGDPTHTSNFGVKLLEHCIANDVACELAYPGAPAATHLDTTSFLIAHLKAPARTSLDTHIHLWDTERPEGAAWPPPTETVLFRPVLPKHFIEASEASKVGAAVVVEAAGAGRWADNQWMLDITKDWPERFPAVVGNLPIGTDAFAAMLDTYAADERYKGIRMRQRPGGDDYFTDAVWRDLKQLNDKGLRLDILLANFSLDDVDTIATRLPTLPICVDHLTGLRIDGSIDPAWVAKVERVAAHSNVVCKVSGIFERTGKQPAPKDATLYEPVFEVVFKAFGPDRVLYGSNWPVSDRGGSYQEQHTIIHDWIEKKGAATARKLTNDNACRFYGVTR